ncbi:hypothetical protein PAMA_014471 [Pampus argenteus]
MTGGYLRVSIMRPNGCWTFLHLSILAGLLLTLNAESKDPVCSTEIRVRRKTVHEASLGTYFRINCNFTFCNDSNSSISWYKSKDDEFVPVNFKQSTHIKAEVTVINKSGISYLIFKNIKRSDSGLYQCQGGGRVSHAINVSVCDNAELSTTTYTNETNTLNSTVVEDGWMYVYSAAGIVGFVITVIVISVISMRGCKGKSKEETHYMEIPMVNQPVPHAGPQLSLRRSPSVPPPYRQSTRKKPPSQPNETTPQRGLVHSMEKRDEKRQSNTVEEENEEVCSVVYAALNHHHQPTGAPARPQRHIEESSVYAAIRVS